MRKGQAKQRGKWNCGGIELNREAPQLAARFLCAATLQPYSQDMQ